MAERLIYKTDPTTGKRKRGRPKKIHISDEIQNKIQQVIQDVDNGVEEEYHEEALKAAEPYRKDEWDFPDTLDDIPYFDLNKTYQATGYKPIDDKHGLDFDPSWFTEARDTYLRTGHYCQYVFRSKLYDQFWKKEYDRCRNGMTSHGYTITGPNYFFLNYYTLDDNRVKKAGAGRKRIFPRFKTYQYEFFHYYELCRIYRHNCSMLKNRGCGFSEIVASIIACTYSVERNSISMITAYTALYVGKTMSKVTAALDFLNEHTDGGFFKLRQVSNSELEKKASYYKYINGQKVEAGFMSLIEGIVADKSSKVRGDRANIVLYEEAGSNPTLEESVIKGEELVNPGGNKIGISIIGGTGGDQKGAEGLRKIYDDPKTYGVLPFKHNYTYDGEYILSAFFIPAYKTLDIDEYVDKRGWCNTTKAREHFEALRSQKANTPSALMKYCAEQCFTAEEALSLEGTNKFNKVNIANQIAYIRIHSKVTKKDENGNDIPTIVPVQNGELRFIYKNASNGIRADNIKGVDWSPGNNGKIHIIEKPLWEINNKGISYKEMSNLYVAGIDSIDIGAAQTSDYTENPSKFCIIIYKRAFGTQNPAPVAYYMDRPNQAEEAYQNALKLLIWYNCRANIEATRLTMWNYSKNRGFQDYFMTRPRATYMDLSKRHSATIGTPATPSIIDHQTDLIQQYTDDFCDCIWFPELLDQLNRYSDENKTHFDMIAAFGMAMLADEELSGQIPREVEEVDEDSWQDIGWYTDINGTKHWGLIPKKQVNQISSEWKDTNPNLIRSSDPRKTNAYSGW